MKKFVVPMILMIALVVTACSSGGENTNSEVTTLVYANLTEWGVNRGTIDLFNRTHDDVQIEVRDYLDSDDSSGRSGKERLFAEIAAGKGPDIIDLGRDPNYSCKLPYEAMARKGVLEDLWPYIENDPDIGREGVLEAPLKAAEVNGKLCAIFDVVRIHTAVGAESIVGDRSSWTLDEMLSTFDTMPEGSCLTESTLTKDDMFRYVFSMNTDGYINWETGECFFNSKDFRSALEFLNTFPAEFDESRFDEMCEEDLERLLNGKQMLSGICTVGLAQEMQFYDAYYGLGGQASFIGYPVEDGSTGSSFYVPVDGQKLAMSATCADKEAAWEFMRQLILPHYENVDELEGRNAKDPLGIRINRSDYDIVKKRDMSKVSGGIASYNGGPKLKLHNTTKSEVQRFEDFLNSIDRIEFYDNDVYNIIYENATAYFSGDKTLDEVCDLIQRRVTLYVNEVR